MIVVMIMLLPLLVLSVQFHFQIPLRTLMNGLMAMRKMKPMTPTMIMMMNKNNSK